MPIDLQPRLDLRFAGVDHLLRRFQNPRVRFVEFPQGVRRQQTVAAPGQVFRGQLGVDGIQVNRPQGFVAQVILVRHADDGG